jgi:hypothetical protein
MKKFIASLFVLAPGIAAAAYEASSLDEIIDSFNDIVNQAIPVLITFAVLYIIFAVVRYIIAGDDEKKKEGKNMVLWGIGGLFIILSIWGLVNILTNTFSLDNQAPTRSDLPKAVK